MNKLLLALADTVAILFVLFPVNYAQAASLNVTGTGIGSGPQVPIPGVPGASLYRNYSEQGEITSIDGLSSLQGVNPSSLTFNLGNVALINITNQNGVITENFGSNGNQIPYFNLFKDGQLIATSNDIHGFSTVSATNLAPIFQTETVKLNGVIGSPFYEEVQNITNGTGILNGVVTSQGTTVNGNTTGTASYTLVYSVTAVPEPSFGLLNAIAMGTVLSAGVVMKRKSKKTKLV